MNDEIKALEDRIEKLESVIVYLMTEKGVLKRDSEGHTDFDRIFDSFLSNSSYHEELIDLLIDQYGDNEQIVEAFYETIKGHWARRTLDNFLGG